MLARPVFEGLDEVRGVGASRTIPSRVTAALWFIAPLLWPPRLRERECQDERAIRGQPNELPIEAQHDQLTAWHERVSARPSAWI